MLVLHVAVAEDQVEIVQHLVANGAMLNLQDKKRRFTPLMLALAQEPPSFEEIFQALLKGKPDLSVQDSSGQTVLHLASGNPVVMTGKRTRLLNAMVWWMMCRV